MTDIPGEKLSLLWRCYADIRRGAGTAYALPVLKYGGKRWSAEKVSAGMGQDGIELDHKWIERKTLEDLGIGPLGRFIDGSPIKPVKLKAPEVLYRGGAAIDGFCSGFEFDRERWINSAEPERVFASHLDFLRAYGIAGGILAGKEEEAALFLAEYLRGLAEEAGDGKVLVLLPAARGPVYTEKKLPPVQNIPPAQQICPAQRICPAPNIRVEYYEGIPEAEGLKKSKWDILILLRPEEMAGAYPADLYETVRGISTRLRLGICFDPSAIPRGSPSDVMKGLFGIRGEMKKLVKYLFRDPREALTLPRGTRPVSRIPRRPPDPFGGEEGDRERVCVAGGARFTIHHRFTSLPSPQFKEEQRWFSHDGPPAGLTAYTIRHDHELSFDRLSQEQRAFFFHWRGEFRRGNPLETYPAYIFLYARELVLSMGTEPPMENFRELLRLWQSYREAEPDLDYRFPQWLIDFAVLYEICGEALPLLLPHAGEGRIPLLRDLFIHKSYLEEGKSPAFSELTRLLDYKEEPPSGSSPFRPGEGDERFSALDQKMRETYGKSLLAFFYPTIAVPRLFRGFAGLPDTGYSAYTAEWMGFCDHKPLGDFLRSVSAHQECLFALDEPREARVRSISLEADRVARLRDESDEVRELLRIEEEDEGRAETAGTNRTAAPPAMEEKGGTPSRSGPSVHPRPEPGPLTQPRTEPRVEAGAGRWEDFLGKLGAAESGALRLIAGYSGPDLGDRLRKLALEYMTMPDLLFDTINETFREAFGDLLIDTLDGVPLIHAEYKENIQAYFEKGS